MEDSDQASLKSQPRLSQNKVYVTISGLERTKAELKYLKDVRRLEVAERIKGAREFGNLAENSEYDAALDEQALVEKRILELEELLRCVKVISSPQADGSVAIGSTVTLEIEGKKDQYTIVGKVEANPMKKMVSNESPLGSSLLGARAGDEIEVKSPNSNYRCKILEIR